MDSELSRLQHLAQQGDKSARIKLIYYKIRIGQVDAVYGPDEDLLFEWLYQEPDNFDLWQVALALAHAKGFACISINFFFRYKPEAFPEPQSYDGFSDSVSYAAQEYYVQDAIHDQFGIRLRFFPYGGIPLDSIKVWLERTVQRNAGPNREVWWGLDMSNQSCARCQGVVENKCDSCNVLLCNKCVQWRPMGDHGWWCQECAG